MKVVTAKYFKRAKLVMISGGTWVLTARAKTREHLLSVLWQHGFRLRDRWMVVEKDIYTANLVRRA